MSWVAAAIGASAVVGAGASYLSSKNQSKAAKQAAKAQGEAADKSAQAQLEMYYQSREDLAPWRQQGEKDLGNLDRLQAEYEGVIQDPSKYVESPSYNFLLNRGIGAVNQGNAAAGRLGAGKTSKDLMAFGQGLASQDYGGYVQRLGNLLNRYAGTAGVGQSATNTLAGLGQNTASNIGNLNMAAGNANAASQINQSNARTGLYSNLSNIGSNAVNQLMLNNYLQRPK